MTYWYLDTTSNSTMTTVEYRYDNTTASASTLCYIPISYQYTSYATYSPPPETDQQLIAREQREEQARIAAQQVEKERRDAIVAAEALLKENLDEQRWKEINENGILHVDSAKYVGRQYRLHRFTHMIDVLENDKVIDRLCIHFAGEYHTDCPADDRLLAQLVLLEADEELVLRTANHNPVVR